MPKVINQDIIDKIAKLKERGYSVSAIGRELGLDRTTVRKYSPQAEEPEEETVEPPTPQLSLEDDFDLRTKKKETELELENLQIKLEDTDGETQALEARREVALEQIKVLGEKLDEIESVIEVDKVQELAARVKDEVTALLEQIEPLRKQREEQREEQQERERQEREEKERKKLQEDMARSDRIERNLRALALSRLAWIFPCSREQAEKIVNRFLFKVSANVDDPIMASLQMVGEQLRIAEDLEWGDNTSALKPLITECADLLKGHWEEIDRIIKIIYMRKKRILIPSDEDMEKKYLHMIDLPAKGVYELFVEVVLRFTAALGRLAEERFIDTEELLNKETTAGMVVG